MNKGGKKLIDGNKLIVKKIKNQEKDGNREKEEKKKKT